MLAPGHDLQRRFYDMLMESQYWPAEKMLAHQRSQLAQLLRHAKKNVPFYETRLDVVLKPNGDIDWDRWNEIPVVTRADLQNSREAMQARMLPAGHGPTTILKSSGSTGVPIETTHNRLETWAANAALLRAYDWYGTNFDKSYFYLSGENPAVGAWPRGERRDAWGPPWNPGHGTEYRLNNFATPDRVAEFIERTGAAYASAMPSRLEPAAHVLGELGKHLRLEAIFTRGESVTAAQRRLFDNVFGAKLVELYAAEEAFKIAHSCPSANHYHIHEELGLVEILGADGKAVTFGQQGEVVVTPFYNTAQPLVRYALGDLAVRGAPCSCGRTLSVLEKIVGRTYHLFRQADGTRFVPIILESESFELGLRKWQLAQVEADEVEFRYVVLKDEADPVDDIRAMVKRGLPSEFRVRLLRLDTFPNSMTGKHILLVNELGRRVDNLG